MGETRPEEAAPGGLFLTIGEAVETAENFRENFCFFFPDPHIWGDKILTEILFMV